MHMPTQLDRWPIRSRRIVVALVAVSGLFGTVTVPGEAPATLRDKPAPDAIFIGGGVANDELFDACWAALKPGGRLVANAVTLDGEQSLIRRQELHGGDLTRIDIATLDTVGKHKVMRARLPVTQWSVQKP